MKSSKLFIVCVGLLACTLSSELLARTARDFQRGAPGLNTAAPAYCMASHNIGKINLGVANDGTFGLDLGNASGVDCFTGLIVEACEYPKGSRTRYLFAGDFWIGAVSGRDTLVSTGADGWDVPANEFHPDVDGLGDLIFRSIIDPAKPEFEDAISEQDYIAVYYDTCLGCSGVSQDAVDGRPHRPLNIEVTQRSFAWSYDYAEDFVLFDFGIRNIGTERLRRVYMGIYVDADIHALAIPGAAGAQDDLCGFRQKMPAQYLPAYCEPDSDIVNVAFTIDNDGDLNNFPLPTVPHVTAMRIVRTPSDSLEVSFNWWVSNGDSPQDYGPQTRARFRDLGHGGTGTPSGDRNKYHYLTNGEFDFDQAETANISDLDTLWLSPPEDNKRRWATGLDTRFLLSFGPFDIEPGQTLPLSFAYVGGEDFHSDPGNFDHLPDNPDAYYAGVDFSDLGLNATWADWIYDNPGIDSDSDGYAGEFTICNRGGDSTVKCDSIYDSVIDTTLIDCYWVFDNPDTVWRKGDGIPDFKGASPPPAPMVRVEATVGKVRVLWNGVRSETFRDNFSGEIDFEGYRVYAARDDRRSSYSVLASYDKENYNKYTWDQAQNNYLLLETPFTLDELKMIYGGGDPFWHPLNYPRSQPFRFADSIFYFVGQDYNRSILANDPVNANTPISKIYPTAPKPVEPDVPFLVPDSVPDSLRSLYLTDDGYFKYYEYEYTIDNLLPTVSYWINVTSFDYGSPSSGLAALETNPTIGPAITYALESSESVVVTNPEVFVYPNPYRSDANYDDRQFENRDGRLPSERAHEIHFANLQPICTIRIFSLDGDLIIQMDHDLDSDLANHEIWDMITRNRQLVVSGLYYWTVENPNGKTQIGKLAIIL